MKKFKKILIANRGEIACRVMRSAAKMGIIPVAVYSEPDVEALHVLTALALGGEAILIGPAASSKSYLNIDVIVKACIDHQIDAVHPGYGFLSENSKFAAALNKANIVFIGPPSSAIEAMGDKIRSKKLAEKVGVSTVPGHLEAISDPEIAVMIANKVGYPVMLKASAGGGGKGMRLAYNDDECRKGLVSAMNEGRASFGDDRVFIEKFIEEPRHIEIQVLGDQHGNVIYLGERECSLQRRHQKVIEEAPSPFIDPKTRAAMGEEAVSLAKGVGYFSAGTVEFIVDKHKNYFFLEMNTRLQVEHPVTEYVTNCDLVEWMIRIAQGEALTIRQEDVKLKGWAVEARLYAEDPERGFLPSTGRLTSYKEPTHPEGMIRIDTGCYDGATISMHYDPMIAKLICHGKDRQEAIANLRIALDDFVVRGVGHNLLFLSNLIRQKGFIEGNMTTSLIGNNYPEGLTQAILKPIDGELFSSVAALIWSRIQQHESFIPQSLHHASEQKLSVFSKDSETIHLKLCHDHGKEPSLQQGLEQRALILLGKGDDQSVKREIFMQTGWKPGMLRVHIKIDDHIKIFQVTRHGVELELSHDGSRANFLVIPSRLAALQALMPERLPPDLSQFLLSPMPGLLVRLLVKAGDHVKAGQELAIVEAMKMENVLRAGRDGTIETIDAKEGEPLRVDQIILSFHKENAIAA